MKPALGLGLAAALLALLLQGWLRPVELVATDLLMRLRGPRPADPRIMIVDIDETGIDGVGRWPWRRTHMARLIDRLKADGARVIALDIVFSEPSLKDADIDLSGDDRALAESIRRAGNVVLGYFFRQKAGSPPQPEALAGAAFNAVYEPPEGIPIPRRRGVEANLPLF
ncbi:MAG TPA: CHASE2 domain-containing protein, partial [Thermoanaerobaculia bacterium]|nr:CHASE2 domain-containing protein [Thermoanaerobaculia bacterium]